MIPGPALIVYVEDDNPQKMLLFTVLSLLALPSTLGGLVPRQEVDQLGCDASTEPTGEKMFAVSYTGIS